MSSHRFAPADFAARRAALRQDLAEHDPTAVLAFGFGDALGAGSASHGALRYLTGWNGQEAQSLLVHCPRGDMLLLSSPFMLAAAQEQLPGMQITAAPTPQWAAIVAAQLAGAGTGSIATIGFAEMPNIAHTPLIAALHDQTLIAADANLARQRMIKSRPERAALRAGAAICDDLFAALPGLLRGGQAAWQIQLALETRARMAGAGYCRTWLTARPAADRPRYWPQECRAIPAEGDQVLFGIALTRDGYWAHGIRMGAIGPARPDHIALWQAAHDALHAGRAALTPGAPVPAADAAMQTAITAAQNRNPWQNINRFRSGHGLGTSYEEPILSDQFPQHWGPDAFRSNAAPAPVTVQPGMVFELHPNLFVPDLGGAALGEMYEITDTGAAPFLRTPLDLFTA
ncbi:MAG: M24 family metallopeptidase [Sulfitobacter sp.]